MGAGDGAPVPPRECCNIDERRTCLTLPNTVLFRPRFFAWEPVIVCANCFILDIEGLIPTAIRTWHWIMDGGATVEPLRFVNIMYKFCRNIRCQEDISDS